MQDLIDEKELEEMAKAGLHFGHDVSRVHPKMKPFIIGMRNNIHVIDLSQTYFHLKKAQEFLEQAAKENKLILFVGTKPQTRELLKGFAQELGYPYVVEKWLGGTFTNFDVLKRRIDYYKDLKEKFEAGYFQKYTKKEQAMIAKELRKLSNRLEGLLKLDRLPDVVFVLDLKENYLTVKEAKEKNIPVVGICDTNASPEWADYPIPANDDSITSVSYILEKIKQAILKGRQSNQ